MRPIPNKMRDEMARDPYYQRCAWHGRKHPNAKIEWHHNLIFAGKQVNEKFAILPICEEIHRKADWKQVRERLNWIMLNRATDEELEFFSKARDLKRERARLNAIYGEQIP